jgi:hypothetical protein
MSDTLKIQEEAPAVAPIEVEPEAAPEATPEVVLPSDTPEFVMPEKFEGKSAEDIAKAYTELEKFKETKEIIDEPDITKQEVKPDAEQPERKPGVVTQSDLDEFTAKAKENGGTLSEDHYKELEEKGISREQANVYKAGVEAQAQQESLKVITDAGVTMDDVTNAGEWARENWTEERITQFNKTLDVADRDTQIQLIQMLTDAHKSGNNTPTTNTLHGVGAPAAKANGYVSQNEMVTDMSDPRYDHRSIRYDPAYYEAVRTKAANSDF